MFGWTRIFTHFSSRHQVTLVLVTVCEKMCFQKVTFLSLLAQFINIHFFHFHFRLDVTVLCILSREENLTVEVPVVVLDRHRHQTCRELMSPSPQSTSLHVKKTKTLLRTLQIKYKHTNMFLLLFFNISSIFCMEFCSSYGHVGI